jgi:ADP-ribosylglycohydrolase
MKRLFPILCVLASSGLSSCGLDTSAIQNGPPVVMLNEAYFRDRVLACWLGKNIGGTLGMPFEGKQDPRDLTFYTNLDQFKGGPAANDDLDLQILWLKAMEENGGRVDARILGEYWMRYVPVDWNEYGECKRNMKMGILPPLSGEFNNAKWKHSNGAWIRSEIWACLAPGCPALAARMAREDACVDHGSAEGTLAEIFTASLESAAFIEHDRDKLIRIGLSMIPGDCGVARAVRTAVAAKKAGKDWRAARLGVIAATEDTGWFQAPRNVAFTMIGWLYGDGDFGKSICIAVGCGDDTDCTGATLGSILGIIGGAKAIPEKWSKPIGLQIKTVAISGFPAPADIQVLTDGTVAMARKVLAMHNSPVALTSGKSNLRKARKLKLSDPEAVRELWTLSPWVIVWNEPEGRVIVDYVKDPIIEAGVPRLVRVTLRNNSADKESAVEMKLTGLPEGWKVEGLPGETIRLGGGKSRTIELKVTADAVRNPYYRMALEFPARDRTVLVPLTLVNKEILQRGEK